MSEQEREMRRETDEIDVEGHIKRRNDEPEDESKGLRREGDEPDVEGHIKR